MSDKVIIRPCTPEDKNIVLSTWLKGNYWGCYYYGCMDQDLYFKEYTKHITKLLLKPGTKVDCAVLEDDKDTVLGYIVYNNQTLYWAYTKKNYRKNGILNTLTKDMDFTTFTANTPVSLDIGRRKQLIYNPLGDNNG